MPLGARQTIWGRTISVSLSASAYTGTLNSGDTAYVDGMEFFIKPSSNSVEGATLNLNGIGAKNIVKAGNVRINIDDFITNRWYRLLYNSTLDSFEALDLPRIITAQYDFTVLTGAVGTYQLTSAIPTGIVIKTRQTLLQSTLSPTSAGLSILSLGFSGFATALDVAKPFTALIYNSPTNVPNTVLNTCFGSFTIASGAGGTIDTVTVNGVNILNGTVAYNTSLTQTAADVCKNINSNPIGNIRAENSGAIVYLYLCGGDKTSHLLSTTFYAGVVSATSTTMTVGTFVNITAGGAGIANVCENYRLPAPWTVQLTIAVADLTRGKFRLWIPYEIIQ